MISSFFAHRAVPGVEEVTDGTYRRSLALPHGPGVIELAPADGHIAARFRLADIRDLAVGVQRSRRLFDLDSDPGSVVDALGGDPVIGALVRATPGRRVPGHADGHELAVRAVLGQQVSVAGAATLAGRLVVRVRRRARAAGRHGHPPVPDRGRAGRGRSRASCRCRSRGAGRCSGSPRRSPPATSCSTPAPTGRRRGRGCRAPGDRPMDGRIRGHAGATRSRRVPAHRPRGPARARGARAGRIPAGGDGAGRAVAAVARIRAAARVVRAGGGADARARGLTRVGTSANDRCASRAIACRSPTIRIRDRARRRHPRRGAGHADALRDTEAPAPAVRPPDAGLAGGRGPGGRGEPDRRRRQPRASARGDARRDRRARRPADARTARPARSRRPPARSPAPTR